jgi:hypothetical protein
MFLHELSRRISRTWRMTADSEDYEKIVRERFENRCPYCSCDLANTVTVIEHLDGMNRLRVGLHVPGNVLVACRRCNNEKRRDDSLLVLSLANSGWESFLSHDGSRCAPTCRTCLYWKEIWVDEAERKLRLSENLQRLRLFRRSFSEFEQILPSLIDSMPALLTKLYSDCQAFAEREMGSLLDRFEKASSSRS